MKNQSGEYLYGVGRRKTSAAQVRVYGNGNGAVVINGRPLEEYFTRPRDQQAVTGPLEVAGPAGYNVTAVVTGGGITGQAGAVMQGLARALVLANPDLRSALRREGFLTRDPREKERKKPGLKRARKAPQYTKR
jgi:small subunit ribosomal protein S9